MASKAQIQTVKADFLDQSLYDDAGLSGVPRLSRGATLTALSRAFDLAEGRRPGHAQRVAYIGVYLASELGLDPASTSKRSTSAACSTTSAWQHRANARWTRARSRVISGSARASVCSAPPPGGCSRMTLARIANAAPKRAQDGTR